MDQSMLGEKELTRIPGRRVPMNDPISHSEGDDRTRQRIEIKAMPERQLGMQNLQHAEEITPITSCKHGRLIDNILARGGKITGKVRCLECCAVIDDPYFSQKYET
jgi:hypothetical protein